MLVTAQRAGIAGRLWAQVSRRLPRLKILLVFSRPASDECPDAIASLGFELAEITPSMLERLNGFRRPMQIQRLKAHLQRGGRGWYASTEDTIVGYACLALPHGRPERYRHFRLYPGEASAILMFTRAEFRGMGLGRGFLQQLSAIARSEYQAQTMVGWTTPSNVASQRMHLAAGYEPAGTVHVLMLRYRPVFRLTRRSMVRR